MATLTHSRLYQATRRSILRRLDLAHRAWLSRRALDRLSDDALADIGITRDEASREASRPIWDVPSNWRQ